jgi:uncharacterized membrane protein YkoI
MSYQLTPMLVVASVSLTAAATAQTTDIKVKEEKPGLVAQAKISGDSAYRLATAKVPGGKAAMAELEIENGRLVFSFDLRVPDQKGIHEVQVDAKSGEIVSVEVESPAAEAKEKATARKPPTAQ